MYHLHLRAFISYMVLLLSEFFLNPFVTNLYIWLCPYHHIKYILGPTFCKYIPRRMNLHTFSESVSLLALLYALSTFTLQVDLGLLSLINIICLCVRVCVF